MSPLGEEKRGKKTWAGAVVGAIFFFFSIHFQAARLELSSLLQQKRVGGSGRLRSGLRRQAHEGLRHGHGGRDAGVHPGAGAHPAHGAHAGRGVAHGCHPRQRDHGDGLGWQRAQAHGLGHAAEAGRHGADAHLVEGGRSRLGHLEGVGVGGRSGGSATCKAEVKGLGGNAAAMSKVIFLKLQLGISAISDKKISGARFCTKAVCFFCVFVVKSGYIHLFDSSFFQTHCNTCIELVM